MDSDFDEIQKKRIDHTNIFYTHGYSWENDIWNLHVIKKIIESHTATQIQHDEVDKCFKAFQEKIELAVYADAYLRKDKISFFPRQQGNFKFINSSSDHLPVVDISKIEAMLNELDLSKEELKSFGVKHHIESLRLCYGHLLADFCCKLIRKYIDKNHPGLGNSISNDFLNRNGIHAFFEYFFKNSEVYLYYKNQFKKSGLFIE